jgi:hypothetical protein
MIPRRNSLKESPSHPEATCHEHLLSLNTVLLEGWGTYTTLFFSADSFSWYILIGYCIPMAKSYPWENERKRDQRPNGRKLRTSEVQTHRSRRGNSSGNRREDILLQKNQGIQEREQLCHNERWREIGRRQWRRQKVIDFIPWSGREWENRKVTMRREKFVQHHETIL